MLQLRANANTTKITVADPRTMSPPANTPGRLVIPRQAVAMLPDLVPSRVMASAVAGFEAVLTAG